MRFLITTRRSSPAPMEMMPLLVQGFHAWRDQNRDKLEGFWFYSAADGGCGIANVADETEMYQMMLDFPFGPFSTTEVQALVDGDDALQRLSQRMERMGAPAS